MQNQCRTKRTKVKRFVSPINMRSNIILTPANNLPGTTRNEQMTMGLFCSHPQWANHTTVVDSYNRGGLIVTKLSVIKYLMRTGPCY